MALTRPILYSVPAFDSANQKIFAFNVVGGDQAVANRLTITDNDTSTIVYNVQQTSLELEHILPPNSLDNNKYYSAVLTTYNTNSEASTPSLPILFRCYTTPTVAFTNITGGQVIASSGYNFQFSYSQVESELLNAYAVRLYNSNLTLVQTSGTQYMSAKYNWSSSETYGFGVSVYYAGNWYNCISSDSTNKRPDLYIGTYWSLSPFMPTLYFDYTFNGFADNASYYVSVECETINRTIVNSGYLNFTVDYIQPVNPDIIELENECMEGKIKITSNMISIDGTAVPNPPAYIGGTEIDLRSAGSNVIWDNNFNFTANYTAKVYGREMTDYSKILEFRNPLHTEGTPYKVEAYYMKGYETPYTNLVTNGNFANGTTGWYIFFGSSNIANSIFAITASGASAECGLGSITKKLITGHKSYIRARARVTNSSCNKLRFRFYAGALSFVDINNPAINQWYECNYIVTGNSTTEATALQMLYIVSQYTDSATATGKILEVDGNYGISFIDLTDTFGAGNEPDLATCQELFPNYIDSENMKNYVLLRVYSGSPDTYYTVYSNYIDTPLSTDTVAIWIRCKDGLYSCQIGV